MIQSGSKICLLGIMAFLLALGCTSKTHQVSGDSDGGASWAVWAPLAVVVAPIGAVGHGTHALIYAGADEIYFPAGETRTEVESQIRAMPGTRSYRTVFFKNGNELWRNDKGGKKIYVCFRGDTTSEYPK